VTYVWDGSHAYRDHANDRVIEPGDELPADVADRIVASHPYDVAEASADASDDGDESESDEAVEWTEEAWLEGSYTERAEAVTDGRVDEHLDAIADAETSENVIEAVEQRRDDLSE